MMLRIQILKITLNIAPPLFFIISEKKQQLKSLNQIGVSAQIKVSTSVEMSTRPVGGPEEHDNGSEGGVASFGTSTACVERIGAGSESAGTGALHRGSLSNRLVRHHTKPFFPLNF